MSTRIEESISQERTLLASHGSKKRYHEYIAYAEDVHSGAICGKLACMAERIVAYMLTVLDETRLLVLAYFFGLLAHIGMGVPKKYSKGTVLEYALREFRECGLAAVVRRTAPCSPRLLGTEMRITIPRFHQNRAFQFLEEFLDAPERNQLKAGISLPQSVAVLLGEDAGKTIKQILLAIPKNTVYLERSVKRSPLQDIAYLWWQKVSRQLALTNPRELFEVAPEALQQLHFDKVAIYSWRHVLNSKVQ